MPIDTLLPLDDNKLALLVEFEAEVDVEVDVEVEVEAKGLVHCS